MVLSDIRKSARESLPEKWGKGALLTLVYFAFLFALGFISRLVEDIAFFSFIVDVSTIIINIPLSFGFIASFMKLKRGETITCYEFFTYGFSHFARSWKIVGNILLKLWLPILLYVLSTFIFIFATSFGIIATATLSSSSFFVIACFIGFLLFIAAFVFLLIKSLLYSLSYFIAYDNENMSEKDVVEESQKLMTGNRGTYILLQLSFIGWGILSIFTLYIGLFWLVPYIQVAIICFYEALKHKEENKRIEE